MRQVISYNEAWEKCMRMWRWIYDYVRKNKPDMLNSTVFYLKREYIRRIKEPRPIRHMCYFCEYADSHHGHIQPSDTIIECGDTKNKCRKCPAQKIDPDFCCQKEGENWHDDPIAFYNKLRRLNNKRLKGRQA